MATASFPQELAGSQAVSAVLEVAVHTQTHRGQTNLAMSGNGAAEQVQALRQLVTRVGEQSHLLFEPEPASYHLMDLAVERSLPFTESAGLLRGQGAGLISLGFAVVAGEVRTLARRSASAAGEIRALIGSSTAQVEQGVGQIHNARDTLGRMIAQVGGVSTAMNQLSTATREQTAAVDQVAEAVRQIGEDTAVNAHSVQGTSAAAASLRQRADELTQLVGRLTVLS